MGRLPVVLLAVGLMMGSLLLGATPARAAAKSFTLYGDGIDGWGFTSGSMTSPGPTITVDQGDTVTMTLYSADSLPHTFHIDYDSDGAVDTGEPYSGIFSSPTTPLTYTFTAGTSGTFLYRCTIHPTMMYGTWKTNAPADVHDVAITSVSASPLTVTVGQAVTVTAVVANQGTVSDTTTVTAYAGAITIGSQTVTLAAGGSQTLTFSWDTTGVSVGSYLVKATASQVTGETDLSDNEMTDGTVTVQSPPPPPPGNLAAELVGRSAWPIHHHFVISRAGPTQTLLAKVHNAGAGPVNAKVVFTVYTSAGVFVAAIESGATVIAVDGIVVLSGTLPASPGRYMVTAQVWFDSNSDGTFDGSDPNTKDFGFSVVP